MANSKLANGHTRIVNGVMKFSNGQQQHLAGLSADEIMGFIAMLELDVETLEARGSDSLDFHDIGVWSLAAALKLAFDAGRAGFGSRKEA